MNKLYGYAGKLLRVDLTDEQITEERLDKETARKYVGGTGIGAKYLYEEVPAGVEWSDEGNRIILTAGPLGGTTVGGSGTFSVVTKGPLTNGAGASQANGFFGSFLRFSGYDGIILQGKAKRLVYLYIDSSHAELRDASHLSGKDTWETSDLIRDELGQGERGMSVVSIGPAGENLVKFAGVFTGKGHTAAHNGMGAVMGSKKLKAIAVVRGRGRPVLKDKVGLAAVARQLHENILNNKANRQAYEWGTLSILWNRVTIGDGLVPVKNYTTSVFNIEPEKLETFGGPYIRSHFMPKPNPCWACKMHHNHVLTIPDGPYAGFVGEEPEYEQLAAFGPVIGQSDVEAAIVMANEIDRLGMDANEMGWVLGMVMECYEKGIITQKDTDGLEMTWGNVEAARAMMRKITYREGFGDVLAEGTMRAARSIGGEAPNMAIHTMKGDTPRSNDERVRWPRLIDTCCSQISTPDGYSVRQPADLGLSIKPSLAPSTSLEDTVAWNAQCKGAEQFEDCLGVCRFTTRTDLRLLVQAVSASTGWDFSIEEAMEVGRRIVHLLRSFNVRHGHTAEMDAPSSRFGSTPVDGPAQGKSIMVHWSELRHQFYEQMGWARDTGKPLPDTLRRFDLEYVIPELWDL
mgnify:CR=1 FL=1